MSRAARPALCRLCTRIGVQPLKQYLDVIKPYEFWLTRRIIMGPNDDLDKISLVYTLQDPDTATRLSVLYTERDSATQLQITLGSTVVSG